MTLFHAVMNSSQKSAMQELESALGHRIPVFQDSARGLVFTEVNGVTVIIGAQGSYKIPAVRTYPTGIESAINARSLWNTQKQWDRENPQEAHKRRTGHFSPIVDEGLKCGNNECPCQKENAARRQSRSLG